MISKQPRVVYYPAFNDPLVFQQQLARAAWYIAPLHPSRVVMATTEAFTPTIPEGYTPELSQEFSNGVPDWLEIAQHELNYETLESADVIICWAGIEPLNRLGSDCSEKLRRQGAQIFDVDYRERVEGSRYIDVSHRYFANDKEVTASSKQMLNKLSDKLKGIDRAFLFCSGPEVQKYRHYRFTNAVNIICNSVINDDELISHINPDIQIFGDPIFHFGCSLYAHEFRQKLLQTQRHYQFTNVIPIKYYNLFVHWQPELADSTIAVPFDLKLDINLDLNDNFAVHTTDNILTLMMLPIAGSLADNIFLLGCDGRPVEENNYFWQHNEKTQFVSQMPNIKAVHPTFFTVDYDDYYLRHCENVGKYFAVGESTGKRFFSLTPSYIPAIHEREHPRARRDSGIAQIAIEPFLTQDQANAYHSEQQQITLFTHQNSQAGWRFFSGDPDHFADEYQLLWEILELAEIEIKINHRFGNTQTAKQLAYHAGTQHIEKEVVLREPLTDNDLLFLTDVVAGIGNMTLHAADEDIAGTATRLLPEFEITITAPEPPATKQFEELSIDWEQPGEDLEELLLDLSFEVKSNFLSTRLMLDNMQKHVDQQSQLLLRMDTAMRASEQRLEDARVALSDALEDNRQLRRRIDAMTQSQHDSTRQTDKVQQ